MSDKDLAGGAGDEQLPTEVGVTRGESFVRDAGQAFLAKLGAEKANQPLRGPAEEIAAAEGAEPDGDDDEELDAEELAAQRLANEGGGADDDEDDDEEEEDGAEQGAGADDDDEEEELEEGDDKAKAKAGKPGLIVLAGLADRGEEDLELEITDPVVIERIRRLQNDGMRRQDYDARLAEVDAEADEQAAGLAELEVNPVGFLFERINAPLRVGVLKMLLAHHIDDPDVAETIDQYLADPSAALKAQIAASKQMKEDSGKAAVKLQTTRESRNLLRAVSALVPEGTDGQTVGDFIDDAAADLRRLATSGVRLRPEDVPKLLEKRVKMYGFGATASPAKKKDGTARPVTDKAKEIAGRKQKRTAVVQRSRKQGASIPSGGRGAVSVAKSLVKKGQTIAQASASVRKAGVTTWADLNKR